MSRFWIQDIFLRGITRESESRYLLFRFVKKKFDVHTMTTRNPFPLTIVTKFYITPYPVLVPVQDTLF